MAAFRSVIGLWCKVWLTYFPWNFAAIPLLQRISPSSNLSPCVGMFEGVFMSRVFFRLNNFFLHFSSQLLWKSFLQLLLPLDERFFRHLICINILLLQNSRLALLRNFHFNNSFLRKKIFLCHYRLHFIQRRKRVDMIKHQYRLIQLPQVLRKLISISICEMDLLSLLDWISCFVPGLILVINLLIDTLFISREMFVNPVTKIVLIYFLPFSPADAKGLQMNLKVWGVESNIFHQQ